MSGEVELGGCSSKAIVARVGLMVYSLSSLNMNFLSPFVLCFAFFHKLILWVIDFSVLNMKYECLKYVQLSRGSRIRGISCCSCS